MPVVYAGVCICHTEPRGAYGLEGFDIKSKYRYERIKNDKGNHIRIYHNKNYYEVCGVDIFLRYFKPVEKND